MRALGQAWALAAKDLKIEARGREATASTLPFAATLLVMFGLAFGPDRPALRAAAPAILWLAALLGAVLVLRRSFELEAEDGALEGLVLSPADRWTIYAGKLASSTVQLLALEAAVTLGAVVLLDLRLGPAALLAPAAFVLGTLGLAAIGTVFAALASRAAAREALLPLLVLPLTVPVLVGGIATTELAAAGRAGEAARWLGLLGAFAALSVASGGLVFDHLFEE